MHQPRCNPLSVKRTHSDSNVADTRQPLGLLGRKIIDDGLLGKIFWFRCLLQPETMSLKSSKMHRYIHSCCYACLTPLLPSSI